MPAAKRANTVTHMLSGSSVFRYCRINAKSIS